MTDRSGASLNASTASAAAPDLISAQIQAMLAPRSDAAGRAAFHRLAEHLRERLWNESLARDVARALDVAIASLDRCISALVDSILHHPRFQQLESIWRGLQYLVGRVAEAQIWLEQDGEQSEIKVRLLQLTKREMHADFQAALELDQSLIWQKIYEHEFGMAGGVPMGVLIGDYEFSSHPHDIALLESMAQVATASFSPFLAAASPQLFEIEDFRDLERPLRLQHFDTPDYIHWKSLRRDPNMRFVGLTLPRILLRPPHDLRHTAGAGWCYQESVRGSHGDHHLWGNAAFAFGGVLIRAFAECGWFAEIRGMTRGVDAGGIVTGLPELCCHTDRESVIRQPPVDVMISDEQEAMLAGHGFVPLCAEPHSSTAVFYANPSLHLPQRYDDAAKTENEQLSSMLQYVLCTSRIAHHLKALGRTWLGTTQSAYELTSRLDQWIMQYVVPTDHADPEFKARHPLRSAEVEVIEEVDRPGVFRMVMRLQPHYQLDGAMVRLETRIVSPGFA